MFKLLTYAPCCWSFFLPPVLACSNVHAKLINSWPLLRRTEPTHRWGYRHSRSRKQICRVPWKKHWLHVAGKKKKKRESCCYSPFPCHSLHFMMYLLTALTSVFVYSLKQHGRWPTSPPERLSRLNLWSRQVRYRCSSSCSTPSSRMSKNRYGIRKRRMKAAFQQRARRRDIHGL